MNRREMILGTLGAIFAPLIPKPKKRPTIYGTLRREPIRLIVDESDERLMDALRRLRDANRKHISMAECG